ncbi:hypothetical protein GLOTRDRAFT_96477 [Gloeophyllum trabeum ATCC 11539]|uniref:Uncharacterized protein n=1 Tax=Gloeophyllum trabeum (strain ATCC 11539 / FP-39264 / Madison 617) TaxID=670483 RepID=S7PU11_GLOTA|nr:uncharacterized protein GLOTRDRAFT_96477 [Gloeophyllum trabeum ATCC 11539]EPQ51301.1 hypothetical protein GLOTRDRAFT_96477 [Gloeophyllum trabeum ATCC 11539]
MYPQYSESALDERYLLYKADNCPHPLWPWGDAITLLVLVDNNTVKKKLKEQKARKLPIESRTIEEIKDTGYILLRPGMAILLRIVKTIQDKGLDADAGNDDLQGWVTDERTLRRLGDDSVSDDLMERMARIMEDVLGLADERSDSPPSRKNGYTGGITFEWHLYTRNAQPFNSQGKCCYSIGYMVEKQAALIHPSKNMQYNPVTRMDDDIRIGLLNVATEYGGIAMKMAPKDRTDLMELNVLHPLPNDASMQFSKDLGRAADIHPDGQDQIGSFIQLIVLTPTPPACTPAYLFLIEFGVFIVMDYSTTIAFSGRRLHSRLPSVAMSDQVPPDAYSIVAVLYQTDMLARVEDCVINRWNALVRHQRPLLGGYSGVKGQLPSRNDTEISSDDTDHEDDDYRDSNDDDTNFQNNDLDHCTGKRKGQEEEEEINATTEVHGKGKKARADSTTKLTEPQSTKDERLTSKSDRELRNGILKRRMPALTIQISNVAPVMQLLDKNILKQDLTEVKGILAASGKATSRATYILPPTTHLAVISGTLLTFAYQDTDRTPPLEVAGNLPGVWNKLNKADKTLSSTFIIDWLLKDAILVGTWKAWQFIEVDCHEACTDTLYLKKTNWLSTLVRTVYDHRMDRQQYVLELNSNTVLPGLAWQSTTKVKPATKNRLGTDTNEHAITVTLGALGDWLGYPRKGGKETKWQKQGALLDVLVALTGNSNIFFLERTWKAYQNLKKAIFPSSPLHDIPDKTWVSLEAAMKRRLQTEGHEDIRQSLDAIGAVWSPYLTKLQEIRGKNSD